MLEVREDAVEVALEGIRRCFDRSQLGALGPAKPSFEKLARILLAGALPEAIKRLCQHPGATRFQVDGEQAFEACPLLVSL